MPSDGYTSHDPLTLPLTIYQKLLQNKAPHAITETTLFGTFGMPAFKSGMTSISPTPITTFNLSLF